MHSNQFEEVERQFKEAFSKIRSSGIEGDIDGTEKLISGYIDKAKDPSNQTILLQLDLNKIIRDLPKIDNLSNHGYLSMAKQLHSLSLNKEPEEKEDDLRLTNPPGLTQDILGKNYIKEAQTQTDMTETPFIEEKEELSEETSFEDEAEKLESDPAPLFAEIEKIDDLEDIIDLYDESDVELNEETLDESLSRKERIRRKMQLNKSKTKMERKKEIALKRLSSQANLSRKARKMAITLLKEKIARKKLSKLSIVEKERLEKIVSGMDRIIKRMTVKLAVKIRRIEQDRVVRKNSLKEDSLNEVTIDRQIEKGTKFGVNSAIFDHDIDHVINNGEGRIPKPTSTLHLGNKNGLHIKMLTNEDSPEVGHIVAHDDSGKIYHYLKIEKPEGYHDDVVVTKLAIKNHDIDSLVKMHDIYHHLIGKGLVLMSDKNQSVGGIEVWKNLANQPDVNIHGWNEKTNKMVNSDPYLDDLDDTHREYDDRSGEEEDLHVRNHVRLIAHKKGLNESFLNEVRIEHAIQPKDELEDSIFYHSARIGDARDYLGNFAKEEDLGNIGNLHVSKFEEENHPYKKGRILVHDDRGIIHHVLTYDRPYEKSPDTIAIKSITANPGIDKTSSVGAHELYNHLLDRGHIIQSDTDQTIGGVNLWKRLSRMKGVNVHGWDLEEDSPINSDRYLRSLEDTHTSNPLERKKYNRVVLVAHK